MWLFEAQDVKIIIIRRLNFEIKPNKEDMELSRLLHKYPLLDLGLLCK